MKLNVYIKPGTQLILKPYPGAEINECKKQAKNLAKMLNGNVMFTHNSKTYMCDAEDNCIEVTTEQTY